MQTKVTPTIKSDSHNALHIAVLYGGLSKEREVSMMSGRGVINSLIEMGYTVTPLDMGRDVGEVLQHLKPDVVFNALHGTYGEDGCVQGVLEILQIPYTHSGVLASAIALNKLHSQDLFMSHGILCPERVIVNKADNLDVDPMVRPYVIKPIAEGSSVGIVVVFEEDDFDFAHYGFPNGDKVIIECYIPGKEIQAAVVGGKAIGTLEIVPLKRRFYDYDTKYTEGMADHIYPAPISKKMTKKVLEVSEKVHHLLGCRGATRAEFRYDNKKEKLYFLEINTHPGLTSLSIVPEIALKSAGIDFKQLLQILIDEALDGFSKEKETKKYKKADMVL